MTVAIRPKNEKLSNKQMLRAVRLSALTAATTRRGGVGSWKPVVLTSRRWLSALSTPTEDFPLAGATTANQELHVKKRAPSALYPIKAKDIDHRWSHAILPTLEVFAHVHEHCLVPQTFVVPSESPWPPETWEFKLGFCVNKIRSNGAFSKQIKRDAARLQAIDFVWNVNEYKWRERILPALVAFANKHGHCDVPYSYVVPSDDPAWPRKAWKLKLGFCVRTIRSQDLYYKQTERDADQLDAIGFVWSSRDHRWRTVILPALEAFSTERGHCGIPKSFIAPSTLPWPKESWGMRLGICAMHLRNRGDYSTQIERDSARLEAIDFVWSPREYQWTRRILPSLEVFYRLEGHLIVPSRFVVPSESPWPDSTWGLRLGQAIGKIQRNGAYAKFVNRDAMRLMEMGFAVVKFKR